MRCHQSADFTHQRQPILPLARVHWVTRVCGIEGPNDPFGFSNVHHLIIIESSYKVASLNPPNTNAFAAGFGAPASLWRMALAVILHGPTHALPGDAELGYLAGYEEALANLHTVELVDPCGARCRGRHVALDCEHRHHASSRKLTCGEPARS